MEALHHVSPLDGPESVAGEEQAGVVVEVVEDFNITAISQVPRSG
jgi:hypothetical protein